MDELEDAQAAIADLNKDIAFNKEDQIYNKYNAVVPKSATPVSNNTVIVNETPDVN